MLLKERIKLAQKQEWELAQIDIEKEQFIHNNSTQKDSPQWIYSSDQVGKVVFLIFYFGNVLMLKFILAIYFGQILDENDLKEALNWFQERNRRFGSL